MNNLRRIIVMYPFFVFPALFLIATVFMDITMYAYMGIAFPIRYYFSVVVMLTICCILLFIKRPGIQYGICIFLLCVHFAVAVGNIVLFSQSTSEIISFESLSAARQFGALTGFIVLDFWYMLIFSIILLLYIVIGIIFFTNFKKMRAKILNEVVWFKNANTYRTSARIGVVTLAIIAYFTSIFYNFTLPSMNTSANNAFDNYTNDRFVYTTFSNRIQMLSTFGTYSYYWSNLSFFLGFKSEFEYEIEDNVIPNNGGFTLDKLPDNKQNLIMLQMETIEHSLINPIVMPNLYNFLYNDDTAQNTVEVQGFHSVDRTSVTEYAALAGTHLDGVEMSSMPRTESPYALPQIFNRTEQQRTNMTPYKSIKAFHNYYELMYNRDQFFTDGLGFNSFVSIEDMIKNTEVYQPPSSSLEKSEYWHDIEFNHNSDYRMFLSKAKEMAPSDQKFFSYVLNVSPHMYYYDANLFDFYEYSGDYIESNLSGLQNLYANLSGSKDTRTVNAVKSYLTAVYEYDRGLGVLFEHLKTTPAVDPALDSNLPKEDRYMYEDGNLLYLIDTTTIVFYSDHHNYNVPDLLTPVKPDKLYPEEAGTQGRMLAFYVYSPAIDEDARIALGDEDSPLTNKPVVIEKFMTHYDVYATICDIMHIKINTKYTLGISVFSPEENIGFSIRTGLVFNDDYATYDFVKYLSFSYVPSKDEVIAAKERVSHIIAVMNNLRTKYRKNTLRDIVETTYFIEY